MFKVFVNFKTYSQGTGEQAVKLTKVCEEVGERSGIQVIPVVQVVDLSVIKKSVHLPLWVQHVDWQPQGQFTGWINLEAVIQAGANGLLLNHSEHQLAPGTIKQTLARIKNLETLVCCKTLGQMERLVKLKPNYIGYEISELIGGKVSICDFNQKAIRHAVKICGEIPLIVGAGIHKPEDLLKARELGARGVLISSAVVLASNPKKILLDLVCPVKEIK